MLVILFHFFLVLSAAAVGLGPAAPDQDDCQPKSCKHGGPIVRYPFRLKGRQTDHCGSNGFDLSCNNKNQTVLELPKSVKLLVKRIDYVHQKIQVYDEDGCVQNQLPNLKLSASPFMLSLASPDDYYYYGSTLHDFTLFNCSVEDQSDYDYSYSIRCLSNKSAGFYVQYTDSDSGSSNLLNCRKTIDIIQVPERMLSDRINDFYFNWTNPACGFCEAHGLGCRSNNTNTSGLECYYIHRKGIGMLLLTIDLWFIQTYL